MDLYEANEPHPTKESLPDMI